MVFNPRLKGEARSLRTGSAMVHQLALSLIVVVILICLAAVLTFVVGHERLASVARVLVIAAPLILFKEFARQISFANLAFRSALAIDLTVAVIYVGGVLALAALGFLTASAVFLVSGFASCIACAGWYLRRRGEMRLSPTQAVRDFFQSWDFGRWVFASAVLWTLSSNLYPWVLTAFHGAEAAGAWAACFGIVAIGNPVLRGIQNMVGPGLSHALVNGGVQQLQAFLIKAETLCGALVLPLCGVLLFFGDRLLTFVYGARYDGLGVVVGLLGLNVLVTALRFPVSRALFVLERSDLDFKVNGIALAFLLFPGLWLVQGQSAAGAALSLLLANVIVSACKVIAYRKSAALFTLRPSG
jgi:O-antigen/teichoic acid export membrane protein